MLSTEVQYKGWIEPCNFGSTYRCEQNKNKRGETKTNAQCLRQMTRIYQPQHGMHNRFNVALKHMGKQADVGAQ